MLEIENLQVRFPINKGGVFGTSLWLKAVDQISLKVLKGQTMAIVGESGSGKTTLALAIARLVPIYAGKVRVKVGGGHGGHNGLRDIDRHLGLAYWRVRIGIGRPRHEAMDVKAWVLADFDRDEQSGWVPDLLDAITDEINRLYQHDDSGFMSRVAHLAPPPST